jgi:hypothetical protein
LGWSGGLLQDVVAHPSEKGRGRAKRAEATGASPAALLIVLQWDELAHIREGVQTSIMIGSQERDQHVDTRLEVVEEGAAMPSRSTTMRAHAIVPSLAEEGVILVTWNFCQAAYVSLYEGCIRPFSQVRSLRGCE